MENLVFDMNIEKLLGVLHVDMGIALIVLFFCSFIGWFIKTSRFCSLIDNRDIPHILIFVGIVISIILHKSIGTNPIIVGIFCGFGAVGVHQNFHQFMKKSIEKMIEHPFGDPDLLKNIVPDTESIEKNPEEKEEKSAEDKKEEAEKKSEEAKKPELEIPLPDYKIDEIFSAITEKNKEQ